MNALSPLIRLFTIYILLSILLFLLPAYFKIGLAFDEAALILSGSFFISIAVLLIFRRGYNIGGKAWLTHTLAAISLKFLLYLFLIIIVFFLTKNRSLEFIITFFVIYLTFTSYLLFSFIKQLKTKNLEK